MNSHQLFIETLIEAVNGNVNVARARFFGRAFWPEGIREIEKLEEQIHRQLQSGRVLQTHPEAWAQGIARLRGCLPEVMSARCRKMLRSAREAYEAMVQFQGLTERMREWLGEVTLTHL